MSAKNMSLLPKATAEFNSKKYWEDFFKKRQESFEWYCEYSLLSEIIYKYCDRRNKILIPGCGNSKLSESLYDAGYKSLINIDISDVVIKSMTKRNQNARTEMKFLVMDIKKLSFDDTEFDTILDKGTLDAIFTDNQQIHDVREYFSESIRVLKSGGRFFIVSLAQQHIVQELLWYFGDGFSIHIHGMKQNTSSGDIGSKLPVFVFVITKLSDKCQGTVEFSMQDVNTPETCQDSTHAGLLIKEQQDYVMVMHRLAKAKLDDILSIELWGDDKESSNNNQDPRYTLTLVDGDMVNGFYGVFIVPQGRETEWQFSSENGQRELAEVVGYKRLAIASLHRGHCYENIDQIKEELSHKVLDLAPLEMPNGYKVPFMSVGESTGYRKVQYDGKTNLSGSVVVQDVQNEDQTYTRQLIFCQMNKVVQSETRLVNDPAKRNKKKNKERIPDHSYLLWDIYKAMLVGFQFISDLNLASSENTMDVLLIGVGGASLPSFVSKTFDKIRMTCVELDGELVEIAKTWFGAQQTENIQYVTQDGLQFIQQKVEQAHQDVYDVIIFDVGCLDNGRILVPPNAFIEEGVLKNTRTLLKEKGALLINTNPSRVENNEEMISNIKRFHSNVYRFDLPNASNKPLICTNNSFDLDSVYTKTKELQKYVHARTNGKINVSNFDLESIIDYVTTE